MTTGSSTQQILHLGPHEEVLKKQITTLEGEHFAERLWQKDPGLWKGDEKSRVLIQNSLGWLDAPEKMLSRIDSLSESIAQILSADLTHVLLMGMGGSSLAPLLFQATFGKQTGGLALTVLDTTDPATIMAIERDLPIDRTLFVVASKSGSTTEPSAFCDYFFARTGAFTGAPAGSNFAAITDPESPLSQQAEKDCYRTVFQNFKDIGGRYSALSYFGLVPAALMGLDLKKLLTRAMDMVALCSASTPLAENPGIILGAAMGELALQGRDKLTFLIPDSFSALGLWLEQLIAESTGKEGRGILPVANEPLRSASRYGDDRLFVSYRLKGHPDKDQEKLAANLLARGIPVISITLGDLYDVAQEFFRWEIATATAGKVLGINPFDQPNVQESKDITKQYLNEVRDKGRLIGPEPSAREGELAIYTTLPGGNSDAIFSRFFATLEQGDYIALLAYLTENQETTGGLQAIRELLGGALGVATTMGYGPRFLHSTGQLHKGGPDTGLFIQLTADDPEDVSIPGAPYTFGALKQAQALGDMGSLQKHGRRIVRVHLGRDVEKGLQALADILGNSLSAR